MGFSAEQKQELMGKRVSVLLDGLGKKEAWMGTVEALDDEWLVLKGRGGEKDYIDKFYIRVSHIISMARYTTGWNGETLVG